MIKLLDILNEGKQVGLLYHVMDTDKFLNLLEYDILKKPTSFTRNKDYDHVVGREKDYTYQIKVDGDKLSNNYKITPISQGGGWVKDEYEELVNRDIKNIGSYILEIIVISKKRFNWKEKGFSKITYNQWIYNGVREISLDLSDYLKKYPNIVLKIKEGHGGKIINIDNKEKWLRSMGIINPKEKEIQIKVVGLYKDKKLILKDLNKLPEFILQNQNDFYIDEYDNYGEPTGKKIPISQIDQNKPYWDSFLQNIEEDFVTDLNNNYVILKQIRDQNNRIIVQILHNKNTAKDIPYYENIINQTGKKSQAVDVPKSYEDYYNSL